MASTIRELCIQEYQRYIIESRDIHPELKRSLRTNERIPVMIDHLVHEFSKLSFTPSKETIALAVRNIARWTISLIELNASQRVLSQAEKTRILNEQAKQQQFAKDVETIDERGAQYVFTESEAFEEERSQVGITTRELRESAQTLQPRSADDL